MFCAEDKRLRRGLSNRGCFVVVGWQMLGRAMDLLRVREWKVGNFFFFVLTVQIIMYMVLGLNVPIARQVIGFFYLTFVPGMVILKLLKLQNLDWIETILFSVGLSLAFLMVTGLLVNELFPLIGFSRPLSEGPLMAVITSIVFLLSFFGLFRSKDYKFPVIGNLRLSPVVIVLICLPILSVFGVLAVNAFGNNLFLLLMIIAISVLVVLGYLSEKLIPQKLYPFALLMIAIALLLHTSLISNYINGYDIQQEYYVFKLTKDNSRWNSTFSVPGVPNYANYNAMLSITILPTIYSAIIGLNETWILKIVYPLLFAFVPLALYKLFQIRVSKKVAFLSTFFFMSFNVFFNEMLGLTRQMVAELFFVLLFFVVFYKRIRFSRKLACFAIFGVALTLSHYSISYIFMFLILLTWGWSFFLKRKIGKIMASMVLIFLVTTVSWYIYVSGAEPFNAIVNMIGNVLRTLTADFFDPAARGDLVLRGIGLETPQSLGHLISRLFAYSTQFLILIGFVALLTKREKNYDREYFVIVSLNMALLVMAIVLPNFARSLQISRLYHVALLFLAPLCILGGEFLFKFISKLKTEFSISALILMILIPFFLFQASFVFEVTKDDSPSIPLSKYRMDGLDLFYAGYVDERDVFSSQWLSKNVNLENASIYADVGIRALISYAMVPWSKIVELTNTTEVMKNRTIYLGRVNIIDGVILGRLGKIWNTSDFSYTFENMNQIYSNGAGEIKMVMTDGWIQNGGDII